MATDTPAVPGPRLNPFAFPSDTALRFVLLIVSIVGASVFMYSILYWTIPGTSEHFVETYKRCWKIMEDTLSALPKDHNPITDPAHQAAVAALARCHAPVDRAMAIWAIGGVAVLLVMAGVMYWIFPLWKIRWDRLVPLTTEDASEVMASLADCCTEAGLSRPPTFLWNPLNPARNGVAFGRLGQYYVTLNGGLVTQFATDRPVFRAVVLHELAHLRNADVDKTYFTVAVWWAFLIVTVLPFFLVLFVTKASIEDWIFDVVWRAMVLAVVVYLMRNAVLRARELSADVRASTWDGPAGALRRVLEALPHPQAGWWRVVWRVHPDPRERRRVLDDTSLLLRMGWWEAFGTGVAAGIAMPNVDHLLWSFLTGTGLTLYVSLGVGLLFAPLVVGVVGLGIWRATFAALARGEAPHGAGRLGLSLGVGLVCGHFLSFQVGLSDDKAAGFGDVLWGLWALLVVSSLVCFLQWIAAGAVAWGEVAATGSSPRPIYVIGLTIAGVWLAAWFGLLFFLYNVAPFSLSGLLTDPWTTTCMLISAGIYTYVVQHPLVLPWLLGLWAFPLAAWFWRERVASASVARGAFLDSVPPPRPLPRQPPFCPRLALVTGLGGGLVYSGLLCVVRLGLRFGLPETITGTRQYKLMLYGGMVVAAAVAQAVVAAMVASRVQRLSGLHGLCAAFVAGCVMTVGALGLNLLFGKGIDSKLAWMCFTDMVNSGALLALPVGWGVSALLGRHARA